MVYIPLLQACVFNFVEKMNEFHGIDMTEIIPENFITLSVKVRALSETEIRAKYSSAVSERLIHTQQTLQSMIAENNSGFAIRVEHWYYQTKRRGEATDTFYIDRDASDGVRIISKLKDPSESHKYNAKSCIAEINKRLKREGVMPMYRGETTEINNFHFNNFVRYFGLKTDERYCYIHRIDTNQVRYTYSIQAIDFIVDELKKAPDRILDDLKQKTQKS